MTDAVGGTAETSGAPTLSIKFGPQGDPLGEAIIDKLNLEHVVPVVNPPVTGGLIDITDPSIFTLTVITTVSTTLSFTPGNYCLEDLIVDYDGKELTFSEIATPSIGAPSFPLNAQVGVSIDWANGSSPTDIETIFTGRIRNFDVTGENNNQRITYVSLGAMQLADEVTLVNSNGRPDVLFTVGDTITSVTSFGTPVQTTFSKSVRNAVSELFDLSATALGSVGIPATIGVPGLEQFTAFLPESLDLSNQGFSSALLQTSQFETGVRPFFDDKTGTWVFHNLLNVTIAKVDIASSCPLNLNYNKSLEDRFTAVHLFAENDTLLDENIRSQAETLTIKGTAGSLQRTEVSVEKKWLEELEVDWTIHRALLLTPGNLADQFFWVFKRWRIPNSVIEPLAGTPVRIYQKINFWGEIRWRRLHGRVIFGRTREVIARFHAVHRGNPHIPGDVVGPLEVKIAYYPIQFNFTFPTSITSDGTPTSFVTSLIDSSEFLDEIRMPESGFEGSSFTDFGLERVLTEVVDRTEVTSTNARALLDRHKDVAVTGDIPFIGDPIRQFMHLGKKIRVEKTGFATGIETTPGLVTGYSYRFGAPGESTISLTTDIFGLLRR